ncbi:MAG: YbjQ family protein [Candidatus Magnetoovum sp. WYHC-5]|nr:YbjQ family protein [Candidatus Magnetoovum sp. WYHC-5]
MDEGWINVIFFLILITVGYTVGRYNEKKHYKSIIEREGKLLALPALPMHKAIDMGREIKHVTLVIGGAVISVDYFKSFLGFLVSLFGGKISAYETLIDRARREAVLRMKEEVPEADIILNVRIETVSIGKEAQNAVTSVEAIAYGTAITYGAAIKHNKQEIVLKNAAVDEEEEDEHTIPIDYVYQIVFSGEIAKGEDIFEVKRRIIQTFNISERKCDLMFYGHTLVVKNNINYDRALKYKKLFDSTGAICHIRPLIE